MNQRAAGSSARRPLPRAAAARDHADHAVAARGPHAGPRARARARRQVDARRRGRRAARSRSGCRGPSSRAAWGPRDGDGHEPRLRRGAGRPWPVRASRRRPPRRGPAPASTRSGSCASSQCTRGSRPNQPICLRASRRVPAAVAARPRRGQVAVEHRERPRRTRPRATRSGPGRAAQSRATSSTSPRGHIRSTRASMRSSSVGAVAVEADLHRRDLVDVLRAATPSRAARQRDDLQRTHDPAGVARPDAVGGDRVHARPARRAARARPRPRPGPRARARTSASVPGNSMASRSARTYRPGSADGHRAGPRAAISRSAARARAW